MSCGFRRLPARRRKIFTAAEKFRSWQVEPAFIFRRQARGAAAAGFYIQALLNDIDFTQIDENTQFREEMERLAAEQGAEVLHERLRAVDPESAEAIHPNNVKRVIRALEYYEQTGEKICLNMPTN